VAPALADDCLLNPLVEAIDQVLASDRLVREVGLAAGGCFAGLFDTAGVTGMASESVPTGEHGGPLLAGRRRRSARAQSHVSLGEPEAVLRYPGAA
jgi:hypothetical protein